MNRHGKSALPKTRRPIVVKRGSFNNRICGNIHLRGHRPAGARCTANTIDAISGALTPVNGSPFKAGDHPSGVAIDLTGEFAYVTNFGSDDVSAYAIRQSGALTPVKGSPFAAGIGPEGAAVR
jgi:6-phosphogluconolactonase (cycloisomerase 2 family)